MTDTLTRRTLRITRAVLALAALSAQAAAGQAQQLPTLGGVVLDQTNREIAQASVTLMHVEARSVRETRTDDSGRYEFPELPPGEYLIEAQAPGFQRVSQRVAIRSDSVERPLTLRLGVLTEFVTVLGSRSAAPEAPVSDTAAPAAAARRPLAECSVTAAGGNVRAPHKVKHVSPVYPSHLASEGLRGDVVMTGTIGPEGTLRDLSVVRDPHPDLSEAALTAIRGWEFEPVLLNCVPVEVQIRVTVQFDLR